MQSAFVDLGLERDAFLYVTDFLELEDQEETDELEKAAASGANQAPREVRHGDGPERRQQDRARPGPRPDAQDDPNQRPERESRPTIEITSESSDAELAAPGEPLSRTMLEGIRRAGRKALARTPSPSRRPRRQQCLGSSSRRAEESTETHVNEAAEPDREAASEIQASAASPRLQPAPTAAERAACSRLFFPANRFRSMAAAPAESPRRSRYLMHPRAARPAPLKPATLDRSADRVGRQRPASRRIALPASQPPTRDSSSGTDEPAGCIPTHGNSTSARSRLIDRRAGVRRQRWTSCRR